MNRILKIALSIFCGIWLSLAALAQAGFPDGTAISLLQWHHFVPRYDQWFDAWAQEWGEANNVSVSVDHVSLAEIPSSLATAIAAGAGHTIIEMPTSPASFIEGLRDLRDLNQRASQRFGALLPYCQANAYLPANDKWYGYVISQVINHGNYDVALWTEAGYPEGPQSWAELLEGGRAIYQATGIPVGIGYSPEPDSEMAVRSILWSFGGMVQDENENVALNSDETIAAVEYMARLHAEAMTDEIFGWSPPSNNQALIAGEASFILNPSSAYRSLQKVDAAASDGIGFTGALAGPAGALAATNVLTMVVPHYVEGAELAAAEKFMLDLTETYSDIAWNSELYNLPCYPDAAPELAGWLADDPFGSQPADKFQVLQTVSEWSHQLGYPGPANPAISQIYAEHIIPNMVAKVALGEMSAVEAVAAATVEVEAIFAAWRAKGLVAGGA